MEPLIKAHVFTDVPDQLFLKQSPGCKPSIDDVSFTFGLEIPEDTDVIIVFNRASYTLETRLPKNRTAFIAAEPDVIHSYSCRFLNQFGIVVTTSPKELKTEKWHRSVCWYWHAGLDHSASWAQNHRRDHDWFSNLEPAQASDKISIVTSNKTLTEFHHKRLQFIETLVEKIPDHLEVFGRGFRTLDDKADALLPYRYHLALENDKGPHSWTEKLADPWLCWAFPFYAGCDNLEEYFSRESFEYLDINNPEEESDRMVRDILNGRWKASLSFIAESRQRILEKYNLMVLLAEIAKAAAQNPLPYEPGKRRYIWSERSLLPEKGTRGSLPEWAFRNVVLVFDPKVELKTVELRRWLDRWRSKRRADKAAKIEDRNNRL